MYVLNCMLSQPIYACIWFIYQVLQTARKSAVGECYFQIIFIAIHMYWVIPRVYNNRRRGECLTIIVPCTNTLRQVQSVYHSKTLF